MGTLFFLVLSRISFLLSFELLRRPESRVISEIDTSVAMYTFSKATTNSLPHMEVELEALKKQLKKLHDSSTVHLELAIAMSSTVCQQPGVNKSTILAANLIRLIAHKAEDIRQARQAHWQQHCSSTRF